MADTETETTAKTAALTTYVILREDRPSTMWDTQARVEAASAEAAIRRALENNGGDEGTYVAIPARSWKPVTVTARQTLDLKPST